MQFSHLLKSASANNKIILPITWLVRILVGALFIYSGFVKAIDPWGTIYKFEEYLAAMGLPNYDGLTLVAVFVLFTYEFLVGIFLFFGCYRKSAPILALIFMAFMLPLTLWVAISNPVADCGCFGDALILTNWETFWKNVIIVALVVWLLFFNRRCRALVNPALQWIAFIVTVLFIALIGIKGYWRQPLIDFRAYPEGCELTDVTDDNEESSFIFIYEKDGARKEFTENDDLPDEEDGWSFVERKELNSKSANDSTDERNLIIWNPADDEDITDDVILEKGDQLILTMPDLSRLSTALTWKINSLYDWTEKHHIDMIALASGSAEEINIWSDLSMPRYPIYTADDTVIKEIVRGNPGVIFLRDGKIAWKSTLDALNVDDFMSERIDDPMSFRYDAEHSLTGCISVYLGIILILVALSFTHRVISRFGKESYS